MKRPYKADQKLSSQYKNEGGSSKFIGFTLAIYDGVRLIYENNGSVTLTTIEKLMEFINAKYGTDFIVKDNDNKPKKIKDNGDD